MTGNNGHKRDVQFKLYKMLLQKYSKLINEQEKRTIGEIKGLVNGEDLTIQSILADLKHEEYSFEKHYVETAKKALDFVTTEIEYVDPHLNINYWLSPKEIFSAKVADDEDLAVFLCSTLLALGDEKAAIVICELDNLQTHALVVTEIAGEFILLDPSQKHEFNAFKGPKEEVLQRYVFHGAKIKRFLYKFNHSNYEQFV
tara:strand:+ start:976 stop:1575 length:600 start_codon:yes stop_codon:yes gene_type:complete